jgi:hypothetical protein
MARAAVVILLRALVRRQRATGQVALAPMQQHHRPLQPAVMAPMGS